MRTRVSVVGRVKMRVGANMRIKGSVALSRLHTRKCGTFCVTVKYRNKHLPKVPGSATGKYTSTISLLGRIGTGRGCSVGNSMIIVNNNGMTVSMTESSGEYTDSSAGMGVFYLRSERAVPTSMRRVRRTRSRKVIMGPN